MKTILGDYHIYERQIERLHHKYLFTRRLYELQQDSVPLASVVRNASKVAKLVAKTMESGTYEFEPGMVRRIRVNGKVREVISYRLTDLIVHNAVADLIQEAMSPFLSRRLYSYRKGMSWWTGVSDFASYVRAHRRSNPDPKQRGIYVLRRDILLYTDSIPVGKRSRVWQMLRDVLASLQPASFLLSDYWTLVERVVCPVVYEKHGVLFSRIRGVPTGQSISCVLFNLYLAELDRELDRVSGGFYARYSDDILFAHPDAEVVKKVDCRIDEILSALSLRVNPLKRRNLYLTVPGRPSAEWKESQGTNFISFLGTRVWADGTVSLEGRKVRHLLRDLWKRAIRTASVLGGESDPDRIGRVVCSAVNKALEPETTPFQQKSASMLRRVVTNRAQLAQLDYSIARIVLLAVTGQRSVKAFRLVPYRKIREEWRLVSLLHERNRWR